MTQLQLDAERARADNAERREQQFRTWWAGVSKQLRDLQHRYARETWEHAESCNTHGRQITDLDAQVQHLQRMHHDTEQARVKLVVGLQTLQDLVRAHHAGHLRDDLTVHDLIGTVESIVWRTLGQTPEKRRQPASPVKLVKPRKPVSDGPDALFDVGSVR